MIVPPFGRYTPHLPLMAPAVDHADRGGLISITIYKPQELIWDDALWIFLYEGPEVNAVNRKLQWSGGRRDESPIFTGASIQA